MRIFLTGACGYIGRHLVPRLLQEGVELTCLIHPRESCAAWSHLVVPGVRAVYGDILWEPTRLAIPMVGCTHVVHLAGLYSFFARREALHRSNVQGTYNVMEAAHLSGLRAVHLSSCTAFGEQGEEFDETASQGRPMSVYGHSKMLADLHIRFLRKRGLPVTILYPASVLGRGDYQASGRYFQSVAKPAWLRGGNGVPMLSFRHRSMTWVHVEDLIDAIWFSLTRDVAVGKEYLVGGQVHTLGEIHDMIARVCLGLSQHPREYFPFDRLLLAAAWILEPIGRLLKIEPPWGLTRDQIRTLIHGIRFRGECARTDLLDGRPYRPIEEALRLFFEEQV